MSLTINQYDTGSVVFEGDYEDDTLKFAAAGTVLKGTILARDNSDDKLIPFEKGPLSARKVCSAETYKFVDGDTMVIDVDDAGNATVTFNAAAGYVEDTTTTYPCADQDGLTVIISVDGGDAQTCTFSGATTTLASILAQMNAAFEGVKVIDNGSGQPKIISDTEGTGSTISDPTGTGLFVTNSDAPVAGTGDAVNADEVTALEVETLIEGDSTAAVTVTSGIPTIWSPTTGSGSELEFVSGTLLAKLGLSAEVITPPDTGALTPVSVLTDEIVATGAGDKPVRPLQIGKVNKNKLVIHADGDATNVDEVVKDQLKDTGILVVESTVLSLQDND